VSMLEKDAESDLCPSTKKSGLKLPLSLLSVLSRPLPPLLSLSPRTVPYTVRPQPTAAPRVSGEMLDPRLERSRSETDDDVRVDDRPRGWDSVSLPSSVADDDLANA
jgi:hypothetical protein